MEPATALEIARTWVQREDLPNREAVGTAVRTIAQSLASTLPQADAWAVIDPMAMEDLGVEERRWILLVHGSYLFRCSVVGADEFGRRTVDTERLPLDSNARLHVTDGEILDHGARMIHRCWLLTIPSANPPHMALTIEWPRDAEDRVPDRNERFCYAISTALGWDHLASIASDIDT